MKLRLLDNSIRIRIQQKELASLHREGYIESVTSIDPVNDQHFRYRLQIDGSAVQLVAMLENNTLTVGINPEAVETLLHTDQVGVSSENETNHAATLCILVEKDFKCLTPRPGEEDAFPHPEEESGHSC